MTQNQYVEYLANCVEVYLKKGKVFDKWFFEKGSSFYFLFKKNLKVTNIQFAELVALIRINATNHGNNIGNQLLFLSVKEFNTAFKEIIFSFKPPAPAIEKLIKNEQKFKKLSKDIAVHFCSLLKNTVVMDTFFGSCAIYLPPDIELDIARICAQSGYIHSCGKNIYIRNVTKATKSELIRSLKNYVKLTNYNKKVFFAVYAHEDFSRFDRNIQDELKYGLDDVKIHVEKYFMGRDSLVNILKTVAKEFSQSLVIPEAGNFIEKHRELRKKNDIKKDVTLWLVMDSSINPSNIQAKGNSRYYICYEQHYMNDNQLHLFDESKPAWKSSTTIPHTLLGAMINITLPYCINLENIDLADPFLGTGTTFLECYKYNNITLHVSDLDEFTQILVRDNVEFFSFTIEQLSNLITFLDNTLLLFETHDKLLKNFFSIFNKSNNGEIDFSAADIKKFKALHFTDRLILYILLRVRINSTSALERGSKDFGTAFISESEKLKFQIKRFKHLKAKQLHAFQQMDNTNVFLGHYSKSTAVLSSQYEKLFKKYANRWDMIKIHNVTELKENKYDIIITDPPYGFNATADITALAKLYNGMIRILIKSLKDEGQIVMSLPDKSHCGKISPFFTHKEIIIQQFLLITQDPAINKEIVNNVISLPTPELFTPPFYWESERALKRSILYFRIRVKRK